MAVNPVQLQRYLEGIDYPVSKDALVRHAEEGGADEETRTALQQLPRDEFNSPIEVSEAVGQMS